ncbi:unnamed protein product [Sphenostylis stenocarpa]|uniref:Uncharacterized protein n=1 Tax=Sphenostylis stenocarpa TaxID=92480 RepID=A0AA86RUI7_9FABA|nr:unnamed protein product [Sphenostylis stenocarpa]
MASGLGGFIKVRVSLVEGFSLYWISKPHCQTAKQIEELEQDEAKPSIAARLDRLIRGTNPDSRISRSSCFNYSSLNGRAGQSVTGHPQRIDY